MAKVEGTERLECGHMESEHSSITRGYGTMADGSRHCYECCAKMDREEMVKTGKAVLYLVDRKGDYPKVTNWPGSLTFRVPRVNKGYHNIAGVRYDFWFVGPDKHIWHGVQYGNNTQIAHCKRTKELVNR